jgi:hypothetical protein
MGVATALAIGGLVAGGMAAAGAFKKPSTPAPPPAPPPPPTIEDEREQVRKLRKPRRGRAKTIITGDLTPERIGKKTLLGD